MKSTYHRKRKNDRNGTTAMEFAFAAPVVFLVIFGCIEITRMSLLINLAQDACYDAARYAMVEGATSQDAIDRAQSVLDLFKTQNATVSINGGNGIAAADTFVTVAIQIPLEDNAYILKYFYTGRFINASVRLRLERYTGYYDGGL